MTLAALRGGRYCFHSAGAAEVTLDDHGMGRVVVGGYPNRGDGRTLHVTVVTGNVWNHGGQLTLLGLSLRDRMG